MERSSKLTRFDIGLDLAGTLLGGVAAYYDLSNLKYPIFSVPLTAIFSLGILDSYLKYKGRPGLKETAKKQLKRIVLEYDWSCI
jgi:hypothetical protein